MDASGHECPQQLDYDASLMEIFVSLKSNFAPESYSLYQNIMFAFMSGKITLKQAQLGIERLKITPNVHNRYIGVLLSKCSEFEMKNLQEILKSLEVISLSEPTLGDNLENLHSKQEFLNPDEIHKRYLTLEERREIRDTHQKTKNLQITSLQGRKAHVHSNNLFSYPLGINHLKIIPTKDYLRRRLNLFALNHGLSVAEDTNVNSNNFENCIDFYLNFWAKILETKIASF